MRLYGPKSIVRGQSGEGDGVDGGDTVSDENGGDGNDDDCGGGRNRDREGSGDDEGRNARRNSNTGKRLGGGNA